jgi:hypothetical protein
MIAPAPNLPSGRPATEPDWSYLVEHGLDRAAMELNFRSVPTGTP